MNEDEIDIDPGEPIAELADLAEPAPQSLLGRVRAGIDRKVFGSQLLDLTGPVLGHTLMEFLSMIFEFFSSGKAENDQEEPRE